MKQLCRGRPAQPLVLVLSVSSDVFAGNKAAPAAAGVHGQCGDMEPACGELDQLVPGAGTVHNYISVMNQEEDHSDKLVLPLPDTTIFCSAL